MQPDDNYWPLRTMPEFRHWAPLTEAGCAVVVEPGRKPRLLRPMERSFWEAPAAPESDHFWSSFDVVEVPSASNMRDLVPRGRVAFLGDDLAAAASWGIESVNPPELVSTLDQLRVHKTSYEVECIAEANRRAAAGHEELRELLSGLGYPLTPETILRTVDYYLARTTDGSTLSRVVDAWVLARSDRRGSWSAFTDALAADVEIPTDTEGAAAQVVDTAAAGIQANVNRAAGGVVPVHPRSQGRTPPQAPG